MEIIFCWAKARNGKTAEMLAHDEPELLRWGVVPSKPENDFILREDGAAELRIMPGSMVSMPELAKDFLGRLGYEVVEIRQYVMGS